MSGLRVYQVAKKFDISSEALVKLLAGINKEVQSHMSTVDDATVELVSRKLAEKKAEARESIEKKKMMGGAGGQNRSRQGGRPAGGRPAGGRPAGGRPHGRPGSVAPGSGVQQKVNAVAKTPGEAAKTRRPGGPGVSGGPGGPGGPGGLGKKKRKKKKVSQKIVAENIKKTLAKIDAGGVKRKKRRRGTGGAGAPQVDEPVVVHKQIKVMEFISLSELSDMIGVPANRLVSTCIELGLMVTINQRLDFDTISLICEEYEYTAERDEEYGHDMLEEAAKAQQEHLGDERGRAPIVTVMGHVDHGKTTLLDYIRKTNVIAGEAGGITQHIGAYLVQSSAGPVSFLDTPGHEAFTAMRARGAQVTDIVILVVAADDAVQPQTIEAISHAKAAGVPIIVAINKIDLPAANPDRVKQELSTHDLLIEEYGGKVLCTEVSAKQGDGVDHLLEIVLLQAEMMELKAMFSGPSRGVVVEARLDKGMGPVATVLLTDGALEVGDPFVCGLVAGRVRAMRDERGDTIKDAGPATPVQILGFDGVPQAGDSFYVMGEEREAKDISHVRQRLKREQDFSRHSKLTLNQLFERIEAGEVHNLPLIIKGDVDGSVEALSDSLEKLSNEQVKVEVIHRGVGAISENDVILASASNAIIIGFHVRPDARAREVSSREGVDIRLYRVIYEAVDNVRQAMEGLLTPEEREKLESSVDVRELYKISKIGTIAGCHVTEGKIRRNHRARLIRDGIQVWEGQLANLKRFKEDAREVATGYECGILLEGFHDIKVGDKIETFTIEEIKRQLMPSGS